mgnify:CR=1 FL=1|jgi:hypothetical protein|tara:strand:+ start:1129 stop:3483 length:2355 start_codon:yes stop_codon:yes gene_type:complete
MSIRVADPLFLLSAQTGMSVNELRATAAEGNPQVEKPQEALKTGEPIPIIFCRRTDANKGGVMVQPKMTEARFANPLRLERFGSGVGTTISLFNIISLKYRLVLGEGDMEQLQLRDCFYGNSRKGSWNQKYDAPAGTWNPGNAIDGHIDTVLSLSTDSFGNQFYDIPAFSDFSEGETVRAGSRIYYGLDGNGDVTNIPYVESSFPAFCGTGGTYSGLTTISFEYSVRESKADKIEKTVSVFVREGLKVTRLVDDVEGGSDNYADLVKYLFEANGRLDSDLVDTASLTIAANFTNANGFFFNGKLEKSQNLLDWLQKTSVNFLLRLSNSGGKFGLLPRLPYNTDRTINTGQITPEFTFTEEHVLDGGFEIEYISLEDREPVCFVVQWRQQPNADFGLVRTVQVRYQNEAASGPFVNIDMSDYCTSEDHAVKAGTYRLAQRKFVTHHLRLTVRERSYNSTLVVGDLVRVRLRRETSEGQVEYHDKMYEINRIEKTFESRIVYDLTHFPIDSQGRSIVARAVDAASGAGNTIDVGRSTFNGDENSSTSTSTIGTSSGGGGTQPSQDDTEQEITDPGEEDSSYPDKPNNPDDPLDGDDACLTIGGYSGDIPEVGDTLTASSAPTGATIEWFKVPLGGGDIVSLGSGVNLDLEITDEIAGGGASIYGVSRTADPSSPDGLGPACVSSTLKLYDEILECPGGGDAGGQGGSTKVIDVGTAYPASFTFTYTAYTIQDRFIITGAASLDTGFVSGTNVAVTVDKTSADRYITVRVVAPESGTAWNYSVGCAS